MMIDDNILKFNFKVSKEDFFFVLFLKNFFLGMPIIYDLISAQMVSCFNEKM